MTAPSTRIPRARPSGHACTCHEQREQDGGNRRRKLGYGRPARGDTHRRAQPTSRRGIRRADAQRRRKANTSSAAPKACPIKIVARVQMGVASPNVSAAKSAPAVLAPSSTESVNRHTPASAVKSPAVNTVDRYERSASPANVSGSPPNAWSTGRTMATTGNRRERDARRFVRVVVAFEKRHVARCVLEGIDAQRVLVRDGTDEVEA